MALLLTCAVTLFSSKKDNCALTVNSPPARSVSFPVLNLSDKFGLLLDEKDHFLQVNR